MASCWQKNEERRTKKTQHITTISQNQTLRNSKLFKGERGRKTKRWLKAWISFSALVLTLHNYSHELIYSSLGPWLPFTWPWASCRQGCVFIISEPFTWKLILVGTQEELWNEFSKRSRVYMKYPSRHCLKTWKVIQGNFRKTGFSQKMETKNHLNHCVILHHCKFAFLMHLSKFLKNILACEEDSVAQWKECCFGIRWPQITTSPLTRPGGNYLTSIIFCFLFCKD